jgi:hypothetical protein
MLGPPMVAMGDHVAGCNALADSSSNLGCIDEVTHLVSIAIWLQVHGAVCCCFQVNSC